MTAEALEADFWAHRYADKIESGKGEEIEDEDEEFDLDAILRQHAEEDAAEAEGQDAPDVVTMPDDFEEVAPK